MIKFIIHLFLLVKSTEVLAKPNDVVVVQKTTQHERSFNNVLKDLYLEENSSSNTKILSLTGRSSDQFCMQGDERIIKIFQAVYKKALENGDSPNLIQLDYLLRQIEKFQFTDFLTHKKCTNAISIDDVDRLVKMINNALSSRALTQQIYLTFKRFSTFLRSFPKHYGSVNSNFTLLIWRPFKTNITGVALYKNPHSNWYSTVDIHKNEKLDDIDVKNLEVAAYIPLNFLEELTEHLPKEKKEKLFVVMFILTDTDKFRQFIKLDRNLGHVIGVSIPGFCKSNKLPMLKAFFKPKISEKKVEWKEFGANYQDWLGSKCILPKISYFGRYNVTKTQYYESVKENYCLANKTITRNRVIYWKQTRLHDKIYPEHFCVNRNLMIPFKECNAGAILKHNVKVDMECYDHPTSSLTDYLYYVLMDCTYGIRCKVNKLSLMHHPDVTYTDVQLYFLIMNRFEAKNKLQKEVDSSADLLDLGLKLIETQVKEYHQLTYITNLMHHFWHYLYYNHNRKFFENPTFTQIRPRFIHQTLRPFMADIIGLVVYNRGFMNYEIRSLTKENITENYESDENVEVIIYISKIKSIYYHYRYKLTPVDLFIIYSNKLKESNDYVCRSRIVAIRPILPHNQSVKFNLYLRTVDGKSRGEGYWSTVEAKSEFVLAYISESTENYKNSTSKISFFTWNL